MLFILHLFQKLPVTSLSDAEYDDIFSSAINRAMAGDISSPVVEHNAGSMGNEVEIEVNLLYYAILIINNTNLN